MKYAVIKTGGKQYRVSEGDIIEVERLTSEQNAPHAFSEILLYTGDTEIKIGQPFLEGVSVSGKVLEHLRGEKIRVAKFKAKARYRRVMGHRQELTRVQIETISGSKTVKKTEATTEKKIVKKPVKRAVKK